ncbi:MAG TPA: PPC domain-containing DNA-binding protein [Chthonomonadaceae bacterium]|nr:PPC domain-containing DNA-binding protein [Chthonomonadaceae bacterium]
MKARLLSAEPEKTYVLIFDTGDEVMQGLEAFARRNALGGSHFTAIGAFQDVTLGYFEWDRKKYKAIPIREQVEVVSLIGDIAIAENGEPKIHAHVVVGKSDGTAWGGHLLEAHVRPTLELTLIESPKHLQRKHDPTAGIALIDLDISEGIPA